MTLSKRYFGVIPARYSSSRFPGKPLVDIFGKPMIFWVCRRVMESNLKNNFCVATDDQRIYDTCQKYDIPVQMTSTDHINGTERVAEVAARTNADIFINIQGDEPALHFETINAVINLFESGESIEYAQAIKAIEKEFEFTDPTVVKIAVSKDNYALFLSRSRIPYPRNKKDFKTYKHIGVYGYTKKFLLDFVKMPESYLESIEGIEQLRAIENNKKLKVVEVFHDTVSIDEPKDLDFLLKNYKHYFL